MTDKRKLPYIHFYPNDWMSDENVRCCSIAARGLWIDLLCLMHKNEHRGYLSRPNGTPYSTEQIANMAGICQDFAIDLLSELVDNGAASKTDDGIIYNRRMVRETNLSRVRSQSGRLGGLTKWQNRWQNDSKVDGKIDGKMIASADNDNDNDNDNEKNIQRGMGREKIEAIYQAYPRKVGRGAALKAIEKALGKVKSPEWLLARVKQFASSSGGQAGQFTPHPATWFNQERWNDEQDESQTDELIRIVNDASASVRGKPYCTGHGDNVDRTCAESLYRNALRGDMELFREFILAAFTEWDTLKCLAWMRKNGETPPLTLARTNKHSHDIIEELTHDV